jgi:hypothetical protein
VRRPLALIAVALAVALAGLGCGGDSANGSGPPEKVPGPGQVFVTGTVDNLRAEDAVAPAPLATPLTISALERGTARATFENVSVAGKPSTISWSSGTPLPITGTGGLDLGPAEVEAGRAGITWKLDGAARTILPGTYRAGAPVAVGSVGLGAPREAVDFQAGETSVVEAQGGVVVRLDRRRLELQGPGKVTIAGRLQVRTDKSTKPAATVTFGPGPFTVTLEPTAGGWTIDSVLQGTYTAT